MVQTQRNATMRTLQELTRLTAALDEPATELAARLVLDSMVFQAEARARWLDHCESSLARAAAAAPPSTVEQAGPSTMDDQ
jgi:hypothetical protein